MQTSMVEVGHSGNISRYVIAGGTRTCIHTPGAPMVPSEMTPELIEAALADGALVYFDGRLTEAALLLAQAAKRKGLPVLVEAERLRPGLELLLAEADYVVTSAHFPQVGGGGRGGGAERGEAGAGRGHMREGRGSGCQEKGIWWKLRHLFNCYRYKGKRGGNGTERGGEGPHEGGKGISLPRQGDLVEAGTSASFPPVLGTGGWGREGRAGGTCGREGWIHGVENRRGGGEGAGGRKGRGV